MIDIIKYAREVMDIEVAGILRVKDSLGEDFIAMVDACVAALNKGGKLVITGVGKSGYIGKKMAATLSSVGSPSIFMHPVEALHGDLGIMQKDDLLIALSYSGETDELLTTLVPAKRLGIPLVSITGSKNSRLAKLSDVTVEMAVEREACPFNLAPTTTTTALLAVGDALAMVLLNVRGFSKQDYGRLHPGGAIGRAVTMRMGDIMRSGDRYALVLPETLVKDALCQMGHARCGAAIVADANKVLMGIFTDGDFRRWAGRDINVLNLTMREVMTKNPVAVQEQALAVEALKMVEERHIKDIIVINEERRVVGLVDLQDLPGMKLM
ncbi:MAG: KpsF/GutQ family sugar-phosphate isomerase [Lentisphaeria bacterium]|nr:KpsF/GutQ family sugar-phosphate isomerase [Lentisphaeria bacterium]